MCSDDDDDDVDDDDDDDDVDVDTDREILSLISNFSLFRDSSWPPMYTPIWWLSRMAFSDIVHSLVLYSLAALNLSQEKTVSFR